MTCLRQKSGQGRLGRVWADDLGLGIALTIAVNAQSSDRLALAGAVGVCRAVSRYVNAGCVGIRWPNDVMIHGKKVAGILIEIADGVAFVGVGVNVHQRDWPEELVGQAASLVEANTCVEPIERIDVIESILCELAAALKADDPSLAEYFDARDVLRGTRQVFIVGRETIEGIVVSIDPLKGLRVATGEGERLLAAGVTSLVCQG